MVTAKVTTNMELEIKLAFELTMEQHHKGYKDALEIGALDIISEVDPVKASELRIQKYEQALAEERQALANYKLVKEMKKSQVEEQKEETSNVEEMRLEKYEESKKALAYQVKHNTVDWKKIKDVFRFKTVHEAQDYIRGKLQEDGLI